MCFTAEKFDPIEFKNSDSVCNYADFGNAGWI